MERVRGIEKVSQISAEGLGRKWTGEDARPPKSMMKFNPLLCWR
jgi:hypothetical protein